MRPCSGRSNALHVNMNEIDLAEEAARHDPARKAEAGGLQPEALRPDANHRGPIRQFPAAANTPDRAGNAAVPDLSGDFIEVAEEPRGEEVCRCRIEFLRCPLLDDATGPHQHDAIGNAHGLLRIVRDDDGRGAGFAQDRNRFIAHGVPHAPVEIGERLVHQEHAGARRDGARKRDPLLLAARKRMREIRPPYRSRPTRDKARAGRQSPPRWRTGP